MVRPPQKLIAYFAAAFASVLMGTLAFFVRESHCSAQCCSFARFFIGMLLIGLLWFVEIRRRRDRFIWSGYAMASGVGVSLCILFYFLAIQYTSVGVAALLLYTGPVFAAIGEAFIKRKVPRLRNIVLISLAAFGVLLVCLYAPMEEPGVIHAGGIYGLLSGLCYSGYILFNRQIRKQVSLLSRTFWQSVAGVVILLLPLLFSEVNLELVRSGWVYLACIGILQGFAVLLPAAYAMRKLSAIKYGTVAYLEPMVAVALGFFIYHEELNAGQWAGMCLVVVASFVQMASSARRKPKALERSA